MVISLQYLIQSKNYCQGTYLSMRLSFKWNPRKLMPRKIYETTIYNVVSVVDLQDVVMLNGFGTVVNALGKRVKPYLPQICGTILWRLNNKSAKVRQQAADLISRIAVVMKTCQEVSQQNVCLIKYISMNGIGQLLHSPLYFPKYHKIREVYTIKIGQLLH